MVVQKRVSNKPQHVSFWQVHKARTLFEGSEQAALDATFTGPSSGAGLSSWRWTMTQIRLETWRRIQGRLRAALTWAPTAMCWTTSWHPLLLQTMPTNPALATTP